MVNRFSGSNKPRQGGFPVTHRQDFEAHRTGGDFRHTADQIDMNPPIPSLGAETTQGTIELISNILESSGSGFISVGSVSGASGIYNVGSIATPTLKDAIEAAMADDRISSGGIILILSGIYNTSSTIDINPNIKIIGESGGTLINGQTSNLPIFRIKRTVESNTINGDSGSGDVEISIGSNLEKVSIENLIFVDNLNGLVNSGNCTLTSSPMIQVERGANFECQNVSFWGRLNDGSVVNRQKTRHAIATTSGSSNGTSVVINKCFFDGICNPINFNTQLGNIDFLSLTNSKLRYYGLEGVSPNVTLDVAIRSSYCNLNIKNNYAVTGSASARQFLTITDSGGNLSNIHSIVSDNTGYVQGSVATFLINNITNVNEVINLKLKNNLWYAQNILSNKFEIKISSGLANNLEDVDLVGSNSLGLLIQSGLEADVVVYPGSYNVNLSSSIETRLSLVSLGDADNTLVNINFSAGATDNLNNRFVTFKNVLKNIRFYSSINDAIKISIYVTWAFGRASDILNSSKHVFVEGCIFNNITLRSQNSMTTEDEGRYDYSFNVKNCSFDSSPALLSGGGNVCLALAPSYFCTIENCYFKPLSGYAISYGAALYTSPGSTNQFVNKLIIKDTTIDLWSDNEWLVQPNAFINPRGSARTHLVDIDDGGYSANQNTDLLIDNLTIKSSNPFYTDVSISRFIYINVDYCTIINSKFEITGKIFGSSPEFALAGVFIDWRNNINISDCYFTGRSNAIKVRLRDGASHTPNNLFISNNIFEPAKTGTLSTRTLLDVDAAFQALNENPKIKIENNNFYIGNVGEFYSTEVEYTYKTRGVVQINAPGYDVDFSSNRVKTTLQEITSLSNENLAAVYINNSIDDNSLIDRLTLLNVNNNIIDVQNSQAANPDGSSNVFASLWCEGIIVKINNNYINYGNVAPNGIGNITDLCLECSNVTSLSDYIISNNIFSRSRASGAGSDFLNCYILLQHTNVYGRIIDNSFSNEDPSGDSTFEDLLLFGPDVTVTPTYERNKNQRVRNIYRGTGFQATLNQSIINNSPLEDHRIESTINTTISDATNPSWLFYYIGDDAIRYTLSAPLQQLIPIGAHLVSATAFVSVDSTINVSLGTLKIYDSINDSSHVSNQINFSSVTSGTMSLSPPYKQYVSGRDGLYLVLDITADSISSVSRVFTISNIIVSYRY